ncbi:MAG: DUF3179 domain-containing (seleno)protein [Candidatus Kapaibacteriota bacterium]
MATLYIIFGTLLASIITILSIYFIMPFPGSQHAETIHIAYALHTAYWYLMIPLLGLAVYGYVLLYIENATWLRKVVLVIPFLIIGGIIFMSDRVMSADAMFLEPTSIEHVSVNDIGLDSSMIVIGTEINGESKAYPLNVVGYHHQVRDSIGGVPVMITYCTVCRTGRIWDPMIDGTNETFRLVGMDHFNAMFEDATTKSWWRQANGEAITGPNKGKMLNEYPVFQKTLREWKRRYPKSLVMLPDPEFKKQYAGLQGYDKGLLKSELVGTNTGSWQDKSWVIGIRVGETTKAYDWISTKAKKVILDKVQGEHIMVSIQSDNATFNVWSRKVDSLILNPMSMGNDQFYDQGTQTLWDKTGRCIDGFLLGRRLTAIPAYQEFWHSWRTFNPKTLTFGSPR